MWPRTIHAFSFLFFFFLYHHRERYNENVLSRKGRWKLSSYFTVLIMTNRADFTISLLISKRSSARFVSFRNRFQPIRPSFLRNWSIEQFHPLIRLNREYRDNDGIKNEKKKKKRGTSYGWIIIELFDDLTANDVSTFCNVKKRLSDTWYARLSTRDAIVYFYTRKFVAPLLVAKRIRISSRIWKEAFVHATHIPYIVSIEMSCALSFAIFFSLFLRLIFVHEKIN